MQAIYFRIGIVGIVIAVAAVTGVLIYQGNAGGPGASGPVTVTRTSYLPATGASGDGASGDGASGDGHGSGAGGTGGSTSISSPAVSPTVPAVPSPAVSPAVSPTLPSGSPASTAGTSGRATGSSSPAPSTRAPSAAATPSGRPASNVPMVALKPGQKAPQFVIFSFDGAGSHEKWHQFMDAAKPTDSRFTGFLSGIYLLETAHRDAYTGPGHARGQASIGFGGTKEEVITEVRDLNLAYARGHEIGTHYNGHFCDGANPSGKDWSTAQWNAELDQFFGFVKNWQTINGYSGAPDLRVPASAIKGGRTPCLEGDLDAMIPAWKNHGMTYDTSKNLYTGIAWPKQIKGIWEFPMPYVYSPGFQGKVMAMDYNFWVTFNGAKEQPETAPRLRAIVRQTYDYMFEQAYQGNRAPVLIANHFNDWNGNSFNRPALDFMKDTCGKPDVYCATYSDVIAWMQLQDPAVLAALQAQPPVATGP